MAKIRIPGFQFAGVRCGLKKGTRRDLALIFSEHPATAAALFTKNRVRAAPVLVGMKRMRHRRVQAVIANSGNANACTGVRGMRDAETMCREVAVQLKIDPDLVIPSSTGVIGVPLPIHKIKAGIKEAASRLSPNGLKDAAVAILTTDRSSKISITRCALRGAEVVVGGLAKGAGMIAPNMATMLAYILTDATVPSSCLKRILSRAVDETFHCITVDGDTSTNDTVLFLANGATRNPAVAPGSREERALFTAVKQVMKDLAVKMVQDGEGGTKTVAIQVEGARSSAEAKKVAFTVAKSQLVKTAFFGADPNFGRIMAAIGYAGVPINPERITVTFDGVAVVKKGVGILTTERAAARVLRRSSFSVKIHLHQGNKSAHVWTPDLTHEYVRINSSYRT
ncbi:MAG: bifunctional glutamate N-acetyltransferase/amino-acid acetyltransferase ArgJ [Candidatus Binatia bacterium]